MATTIPSTGLKLHLAAWNPNGNEGAGLVSGSFLPTWTNLGSGVGDAAQASTAHQPQWKAKGVHRAVQFDSVSDRLEIASSDSTLSFIHTTGIFDISVVARGAANKYGVIIGSAYNTGDKGILLERNFDQLGAPLTLWFFGGASGFKLFQTASYLSPTPSFEPGKISKVLFRGNGTHLQGSADYSTVVTGPALGTLPTGSATNTLQVGAFNGAHFYAGDILDIAIYSRNLSASELTTVSTYLNERYGV